MARHRIVGGAWLALIAVGLLWLGVRVADVAMRPALVDAGQPAPALEVEELDGSAYAPPPHALLLVDFWHHACRPCVAALPVFERLQQDFGPLGLHYVGVHVGAARAEVRALTEGRPLDFAIDEGEVARAYGVHTFPTLVLVDSARRVRKVYRKGAAEELLRRDLERLLGPRHAKRLHPVRRQ